MAKLPSFGRYSLETLTSKETISHPQLRCCKMKKRLRLCLQEKKEGFFEKKNYVGREALPTSIKEKEPPRA